MGKGAAGRAGLGDSSLTCGDGGGIDEGYLSDNGVMMGNGDNASLGSGGRGVGVHGM